MKESRLTTEQLAQLKQEQLQKEAEERKMRSEQARRRSMESKHRELEEVLTPELWFLHHLSMKAL